MKTRYHWIDVLAFLFLLLVLSSLVMAKYKEWKELRHSEDVEMITGVPTVW